MIQMPAQYKPINCGIFRLANCWVWLGIIYKKQLYFQASGGTKVLSGELSEEFNQFHVARSSFYFSPVSARLHNSHLSVCSAQSSWERKNPLPPPRAPHYLLGNSQLCARPFSNRRFISTPMKCTVQKNVRAFIMRFPAVAICSLADAAL